MGFEIIFKYIQMVMLILPLIEKIVGMIEGAFTKLGGGSGEVKKAAAMEVAKASLTGAGLDLPDETLSAMIDSVVGVKNASGEFKKTEVRAPPETPPGRKFGP